ncbi:MAG: hypothetical protein ABIQ64_03700 [Candidatus Saccharimonadales bacterium]
MTLPAKTHQTQPATKKLSSDLNQSQDQRSYLAMMLLAVFAMPTGLARAYRGEQQGWTRFWVYIGATVISVIPLIGQLIGGLTLVVLLIIGLVDVFTLRHTTTDAFNKPLHTTTTDKKWAHGFFMYVVVLLVLGAIVLLLAIVFGAIIYENFDQLRYMNMDTPAPLEQPFEPSSF